MTNEVRQLQDQIEVLDDSDLVELRQFIDTRLADEVTGDEALRVQELARSQRNDPDDPLLDASSPQFWVEVHDEAMGRLAAKRMHG